MKLKQRVGDFQVRELISDEIIQAKGPHRVYRVTKRKLTSREAARILAEEAGVEQAAVSMCGWKDRQGVTVQHMSVPHGRDVMIESSQIKIGAVGFAANKLDSSNSRGNAFEIRVRDLDPRDLSILRSNLDSVRENGVANYFDDQRFGNLTHGQGWIARDLMTDKAEHALRTLLSKPSPHDDERYEHFKARLRDAWGDWSSCFDIAKRFREHHSIFEHLQRNPTDFKGAFQFVATRLRLIHLYAYQSHIWNRAVASRVRESLSVDERVVMQCEEGKLLSWSKEVPAWANKPAGFPLPGPELVGVDDHDDYGAFRDVLAEERMTPTDFKVEGVPGFQLKAEDRLLVLRPNHLRVRPREKDNENPGRWSVALRFELPRGAYATMVVKRLFATALGDRPQRMGPPMGRGGESGYDSRRSGGYQSGGGFRGADDRGRDGYQHSGGSQDRGGDQGRGGQDRGGYQGRGGQDRGGYQGRGGQDRGSYQGRGGQDGGGYQGGGGQERGGYQGRGGQDRGGYQGGGGQERGGYQGRGGQDRGGYQGGGGQDRGGDQGRGGQERGGYQGRGGQDRGGYQGGGGQDRGGYQGRGGQDRGGYQGGGGQERGGYQGRGGQDRGGYQGGGGQDRGGYQGRGGQDRGGDQGRGGQERGGYQGRGGQDRGGYQGRGGQERGGYQGRGGQDRGGYQGGGGQERGGYQGRGDQDRGGQRHFSGGQPGGSRPGAGRPGPGYQGNADRSYRGGNDRPGRDDRPRDEDQRGANSDKPQRRVGRPPEQAPNDES